MDIVQFIDTDYRDYLAERWPAFHVDDCVAAAKYFLVGTKLRHVFHSSVFDYFPELREQLAADEDKVHT